MPWNQTYIDSDVEKQLVAPMPWIGMYVAAASAICTLAMAADSLHGFWRKRHWFPSRYFSINATSLTLLAVSMKLPVDLTTRMYAVTDRLAKVSSLVFMSTAMANFLPSLGSMSDKDVLMNVTALSILVITVTANVTIQIIQVHSYLRGRLAFLEEMLAVGSMLLLLVMFTSSALMIPSTKRYLEKKYHEMHKTALNEEQVDTGRVSADKLRVLIKKYWVMAETSSPQFVIARSVTCTTSGAVSLIVALVLLEAEIRLAMKCMILEKSISNYGWSTKLILLSQTIGVIVGTIAPASRWFIAVNFRSKNESGKSIRSVFTVEGYWTQKMVDWRQGSISFQIRHLKSRKFLHNLRRRFLKLCISVQYFIVLASKMLLLVSVCITSPVISCINYARGLKKQKRISHCVSRDYSTADPELDVRHYVMLLEGEQELPTETLENICKEVDEVIRKGKMKKPESLLKLLEKSRSFNGVTEFDSRDSRELPYCWSLPVVTLTSIALALPNIEKQKSELLLSSVTEGLYFVKLVDKTLDKKSRLANVRTAADVVWVGVELYHKWQDKDLHETSLKGKNADEILQQLRDKAEKTVVEFRRDARDCLMKNPLNWPAKVIAANSMYRISRTVLLTRTAETDDELFEQLSVMIADILAACFTNLGHVITMKCHCNAIEEREKSVRKAALLLGETEEILALLCQRELPLSAPNRAASVEEWRALIDQERNKINTDFSSKSNIETGTKVEGL
ncbi:hypothetical protein ABFX02_09G019300 [Erythranthe guttata]